MGAAKFRQGAAKKWKPKKGHGRVSKLEEGLLFVDQESGTFAHALFLLPVTRL